MSSRAGWSLAEKETAALLSSRSPLAPFLSQFEERPQQQQMCSEVVRTFNNEGVALIEAGTGTGKSLAYLLPALLWAKGSGERIVISTHTIALQEQLLKKDLPDLIDALSSDLSCVVVKGMRHYLCLSRLSQALESEPPYSATHARLEGIESTLHAGEEELAALPQVRAEYEHCNGPRCSHYNDCLFFRARKEADAAEILIVNHHLLLLDYARRREDPSSRILPPYTRLIIDEAHHLDSVATNVFAKRLSLTELTRELGKVAEQNLPVSLLEKIHALTVQLSHFALPLSDKLPFASAPLPSIEVREEIQKQLMGLEADLYAHAENLKEPAQTEIAGYGKKFGASAELFHNLTLTEQKKGSVRWVEPTRSALPSFCEAVVDTSSTLRAFLSEARSAVLTSATLRAGSSFDYTCSKLGLEEKQTLTAVHTSPFDFASNSALYVPTDMPPPDTPAFIRAAAPLIETIVRAACGGALILCTSYRQLDSLFEALEKKLSKFKLMRQGEKSRTALLESFREEQAPVLFATSSFWEGVDMAGSIRALVIAKLPFQVPTDPLAEAQYAALEAAGKNPFIHHMLAQATLRFVQGFGRLIRTKNSRGAALCLDSRLHTKGYGKKFLEAMPAPITFGTASEVKQRVREFWSVTESNR